MQPSLNTPVRLAILSLRCNGRCFLNDTVRFRPPQPMSVPHSCFKDPFSRYRRPHLLSNSHFLLSRRRTPNIIVFYYRIQSPSPPLSFFKTDLWTFCLWKVYGEVDASRSCGPYHPLPRSPRLCLLQYDVQLLVLSQSRTAFPLPLTLRLSPHSFVFF